MQKNLYFRQVLRRRNVLKEFIFNWFLDLCSYPRIILEVFIKGHFGERYFSMATAISAVVFLALLPLPMYGWSVFTSNTGSVNSFFWFHIFSWYIFLAVFIKQAVARQREINREASVFDFGKFSLSQGILQPKFRTILIRTFGNFDSRTQETILEPVIFFVIGLVLMILGQYLGWLLFGSSFFYSVSYFGAYYKGDQMVMDIIDERTLNEEMERAFVEDLDPSQTRGVRIFARKPTAEDLRRKVADSFIESTVDEILEAR